MKLVEDKIKPVVIKDRNKFLATLRWRHCEGQKDIETMSKMMDRDLSEKYPEKTYNFYITMWPELVLILC